MATMKEMTKKARQSALLGTFATMLLISTIVFLAPRPRPVESRLNPSEAAEEAALVPVDKESQPPAYSKTVAVTTTVLNGTANQSSVVVSLPELAHERTDALRVPADLVLAKVNGTD